MAGQNSITEQGGVWVVSMGHLMGLFDQPWLGIPPTGKIAMLRYCEFNRVDNGKITETAMFFDIPHLMMQAGLQPFPPQTAAHLVQPGPMTHDGLMFDPQDPEEGRKTLDVTNAMISDLGTWALGLPLEEELARTWNDRHGLVGTRRHRRYLHNQTLCQTAFRALSGHILGQVFNRTYLQTGRGSF